MRISPIVLEVGLSHPQGFATKQSRPFLRSYSVWLHPTKIEQFLNDLLTSLSNAYSCDRVSLEFPKLLHSGRAGQRAVV